MLSSAHIHMASNQGDQMGWLFVKFLVFYDNENFPYYQTICTGKKF